MFLSKVKFAAMVLLALGVVGSGAGFVAHRTGAEQPASKTAPARALPAASADKAKAKEGESKPAPKPDKLVAVSQSEMLTPRNQLRDLLARPIQLTDFSDPNMTLTGALDKLAKRYNLNFRVNETAFKFENIQDVGKSEIAAEKPIPAMHANLCTILQTILDRVPVPSGAAYLLRKDHVEITTNTFIKIELGRPEDLDIPPEFLVRPGRSLVWDIFEDIPIAQALQRIADTNDLNVVTDSRVAKNLQLKVTARFNNVAADTVMRLLTNMAGLSVVQVDNVFYVTTAENAKQLREEQVKIINLERFGAGPPPEKPTK